MAGETDRTERAGGVDGTKRADETERAEWTDGTKKGSCGALLRDSFDGRSDFWEKGCMICLDNHFLRSYLTL
jgi:hypothetical protein